MTSPASLLSAGEILKRDSLGRVRAPLAKRQEILAAFDGSGMSAARYTAMFVISRPIRRHCLDGLYFEGTRPLRHSRRNFWVVTNLRGKVVFLAVAHEAPLPLWRRVQNCSSLLKSFNISWRIHCGRESPAFFREAVFLQTTVGFVGNGVFNQACRECWAKVGFPQPSSALKFKR